MQSIKLLNIKATLYVIMTFGFILEPGCITFAQSQKNFKSNITDQVAFYADQTHQLGLNEVMLLDQHDFIKVHTKNINFGNNTATIWGKLNSNDWIGQAFILGITSAQIDDFRLYIPDSLGDYQEMKGGRTVKFSERDMQIPGEYFLISSNINHHLPIYFQIKCHYLHFGIYTDSVKTYTSFLYQEGFWHGLFYGAIILMVLYNLFLYLSIKEKSYLYYIFYVLSSGLFVADMQGHGLMFFYGEMPWLSTKGTIIPSIYGLAAGLFATSFLNIRRQLPSLYKWFLMTYGLFITGFVLGLMGYWMPSSIVNQIATLWGIILIVYSSVKSIKRGMTPAIYFLVGWAFYLSAVMVIILSGAALIPYAPWMRFVIQIGVSVEMTLLSIALAERINVLKKEKNTLMKAYTEELERQVEVRTREMKMANEDLQAMLEQVSHQNRLIREYNTNMFASIQYAQKLQQSILPSRQRILNELGEHFIFYAPKDVVSGDFYWFTMVDGLKICAVIDCTGHGVPGAFMSLIGANLLKHIVNSQKITSPEEILYHLNIGVEEALDQYNSDNRDGMDVSICTIDDQNKKLYFAGAKNPLIYFQHGNMNFVKGNSTPIGGRGMFNYDQGISYTLHTIDISVPTQCYIFSDGYADQFGGKNGKKFLIKRFRNLLMTIHNSPFFEQGITLREHFENWKNEEEQVDDVLVWGFRV